VPKTVSTTKRTVELTWTTGQRVLRQSAVDGELYYEELEVSPRAVDLRRLKRGAALLAAHQATSLQGILGVVEDAWLTDGAGHARVRFSARPKAAEIFADVKAGIIRNVSVGYITHEAEELDRKRGQLRVVRATRWEPLELSLVAVPANSGAVVRARAAKTYPCRVRRRAMFHNVQPSQRAAVPALDADSDVRSRGYFRTGRPENASSLVEPSASPVGRVGLPPSSSATPDAVARALLYRIDPGRWPLTPGARHWTGIPLTGIVRDLACAGGVDVRARSFDDLARIGLGLVQPERVRGDGFLVATDFPAALLQVVRATLTAGYQGAPRTFLGWVARTTVPDFRVMNRVSLGTAPKLLAVPEHAEYQRGKIDGHVETLQLGTWGRVLAVTRQAIVNDDLSAFARLPQQFGYAAAQLEGDLIYSILTSNPAMSDGNALFSAAHKNLASPAGIDLNSMGAARQLMRTQTSTDGQLLNIEPRYLIVGPFLETVALQFTSSTVVPTAPTGVIPQYFKSLEVVCDPRITDTSWYLAASPLQIDTVELARLAGTPEEPEVLGQPAWNIDGFEFKGRIDRAAAAVDWKGLVKTPGV